MKTPVYNCILVREGSVDHDKKANSPQNAIDIANALTKDAPNERFISIMLDTKLGVIGTSIVAEGLLDQATIHPREVFRSAIIANAKAIIIAHNHPSGDLAPSTCDDNAWKMLSDAGKIIGIEVIDSIIVDGIGGGLSMKEERQ